MHVIIHVHMERNISTLVFFERYIHIAIIYIACLSNESVMKPKVSKNFEFNQS